MSELQVFMLPADAVLDRDTLMSVLDCEHSRVPVYEGGDRCAIPDSDINMQSILHDAICS